MQIHSEIYQLLSDFFPNFFLCVRIKKKIKAPHVQCIDYAPMSQEMNFGKKLIKALRDLIEAKV